MSPGINRPRLKNCLETFRLSSETRTHFQPWRKESDRLLPVPGGRCLCPSSHSSPARPTSKGTDDLPTVERATPNAEAVALPPWKQRPTWDVPDIINCQPETSLLTTNRN